MPAGNLANIIFGTQVAKGTPLVPSATNTYQCLVAGGWIEPERTVNDLEETGSTRMRSTSYVSEVHGGGSPEFFAREQMIGHLLYATLGAKAVSGASDPWTHTFTPATTQPYLTFWTMLANSLYNEFSDCKIASFTFVSEAGAPARVTVEIVGGKIKSKAALPTPVRIVEVTAPFLHAHGVGALKVEGVAISAIDRFSLTINTGVAAAQGDNFFPDSINEGMMEITAEVGQIIADFAEWNRLHYGSASPAADTAPSTDVLTLAGSPAGLDFKFLKAATPERSLEFLLPNLTVVSIADVAPSPSGEPLRKTATYRALQPVSGSAISALLKNGLATYPG